MDNDHPIEQRESSVSNSTTETQVKDMSVLTRLFRGASGSTCRHGKQLIEYQHILVTSVQIKHNSGGLFQYIHCTMADYADQTSDIDNLTHMM
jgi:ribosomal protein S4